MKNFKKIFAEIISRGLDPVWEMPAALLIAVGFAVHEGLRWRFLGLLLFIDAIVPVIFFLTMLYHKQIKDWDMQKRSERIPLYIFTMICHLGGIWLAHELGKVELVNVLLVFYAVGITFALTTFKWKISLHAGVNAGLITIINIFYGWRFSWLYLLLCLVMWARVYQKHHTWAQVIAGAIVGSVVVGVGLSLL
ncbi:MAG: hypothetical protein WCG44_02675 [bacterium]